MMNRIATILFSIQVGIGILVMIILMIGLSVINLNISTQINTQAASLNFLSFIYENTVFIVWGVTDYLDLQNQKPQT